MPANTTATENCQRCGTALVPGAPTWPLCPPCNDHYVRTGEATAPRYTVNDSTGTTHALGVTLTQAVGWAGAYAPELPSGTDVPAALDALAVGATWRTHADWRGLSIIRTA